MNDYVDPSLGLAVALISMGQGAEKNRNAVNFMMSNASMVVGWKRAGLTHGQIADAMVRLGFSISGKHVRNTFAKLVDLAVESDVLAFKLALHRKFLIQADSSFAVQPDLSTHCAPTSRARSAAPSPAVTHAVTPIASQASVVYAPPSPSPVASPVVRAPVLFGANELVKIDGEDGDEDSDGMTKQPRSFGDFRRRLWSSMKSDRPLPFVEYEDGQRLQVPGALIRPLFEGKFKNWKELMAQL